MIQQNDTYILIVDDEESHLNILEHKLAHLGYTNIMKANTYKAAVKLLEEHEFNLVILDYYLDKGHLGTELLQQKHKNQQVPVIFISSFYSEDVLNQIVDFGPVEFLPKGVSEFDLSKVIRLLFNRLFQVQDSFKLKDFMFVRYNKLIKKLQVKEIKYISVDGKYVELWYQEKRYLVRSTLNEFLEKLPENFIKISQSHIINLNFLDSIDTEEYTVKLGEIVLPYSRNYKKELFNAYYLP
jgi:DNA-binding LytR/AlgR family response regulator